ncbi:Putative L,D-transpeptidase YqjB [Planktothrix tepida]|uniref:ErfK/YbiS/YcfS/YnhG-like protein n=1 Tax=Planktothrix tepida PCC 9214 TaxID=671072 RepID=A0A1J1LV48_9CYAN|nr:L,D-transpeptidase [Planktothrix tepida]CAD5978580.1 Putative L,D-transpeptidase YqjB [Planktothrix tepida]CUR36102.1 ErfK/YbiS/YcfS/YnhG-like protein [Planktothrix tepida PCC 9214]
MVRRKGFLKHFIAVILGTTVLLEQVPKRVLAVSVHPQNPIPLAPSPVKLLTPRTPKFATSTLFPPSKQPSSDSIEANLQLVIKLNQRRVYVYRNQKLQTSYPIAVGREGWETPVGQYQVIQMITSPTWEHPLTGEIIPPGPDNPLGQRWIGFWTDGKNYIGFHGTPNTETVGQAASHGCIRMFNQDVLALFEMVKIGTPVIVEP